MEDYIPNDLIIQKARVNPSHIGYINSIVESYEGLGQVRTQNNRLGIIIFWIMPDLEHVFRNLIKEFMEELDLSLLEEDNLS